MTTRVHCKKTRYDVCCGRPSKFGNKFVIGKDGDRDEVIDKYERWIKAQPELLKELPRLKNKILGCWCFENQRCRCDVLIKLIEKEHNED